MQILIKKEKMIFSEANDNFKYNILPVGEFYDERYGWLSFDEKRLKNLEERFKDGVPAYEVPIKKGHWEEDKMGAIEKVWFEEEIGLWIQVKLNEEGKSEIDKQDYLSAELELYTDKKTGEGAETLTGAAFTNKPANPYVKKIELSEDKTIEIIVENEKKKEEDIEMLKTVEELEKELEEVKQERVKEKERADQAEQDKIKLSEDKKKLTIEKCKQKWENEGVPPAVVEAAEKIMFSEINTEGKILLSEEGKSKAVNLIEAVESIVEAVPKIELGERGNMASGVLEGEKNEDEFIKNLGEGGTL